MAGDRFYEAPTEGRRRSAPAALRNRAPIAEVLRDWLPRKGKVLEIASGTGEHAIYFAECFPNLEWQPSDPDPAARESISAWQQDAGLSNLNEPLAIDAAGRWPEVQADAILCINMAHISPWAATLGLLDAAGRLLPATGRLIFYGPWFAKDVPTAPSNFEFDAQLRSRNPEWGIRAIAELSEAAAERGLLVAERKAMPANNVMLLLTREEPPR